MLRGVISITPGYPRYALGGRFPIHVLRGVRRALVPPLNKAYSRFVVEFLSCITGGGGVEGGHIPSGRFIPSFAICRIEIGGRTHHTPHCGVNISPERWLLSHVIIRRVTETLPMVGFVQR